jgi:Fic family protein
LKQSNPYLKDPEAYEEALIRSVVSSSAIEGVSVSRRDLTLTLKAAKPRKS